MLEAHKGTARKRPRGGGVLGRRLGRAGVYGGLLILTFIVAYPFLWTVSTSLKLQEEVFAYPPSLLPPVPQWGNYAAAWNEGPWLVYFRNTAFLAATCTALTLLGSSMAAYAFGRLRGPGSRVLFSLFLATMMVPPIITLIPSFLLYKNIGWLDSYLPLIVPTLGGNAFAIFFLRQAFMGVPRELDDAARIDGCTNYGIYWRIDLPLVLPSLITIGVLTFMYTWNDYMAPNLYLNNANLYTVQLGLQQMVTGLMGGGLSGYISYPVLMAATIIGLLPNIIAFLFVQRYITRALLVGGLKG